MVAPVRVKNDYPPPDENDLATPAREITSRHRVDRRSLLPPRRVIARNATQPHLQRIWTLGARGRSLQLGRENATADRGAADCCLGGSAMRVLGNALVSGLRGRGHPLGRAEELSQAQRKVRGLYDLALSQRYPPPLSKLYVPDIGKFRPALRSTATTVADFIE
jgi:hypothetical protein